MVRAEAGKARARYPAGVPACRRGATRPTFVRMTNGPEVDPHALAQARALLAAARRIVVLTGAGISAESGVPTFRGAGGLWKSFRAEELATPEAFARDPRLVWEWYAWRRALVAACTPNAAHLALARLALSPS